MCPQITFHTTPTGLNQIQRWTRQSLREKPFATAKGKIWTLTPNYIPLEKIYTSLSLIQKERKTASVKRVPLPDITQLFSNEILQGSPPDSKRILVTGKLWYLFLKTIIFGYKNNNNTKSYCGWVQLQCHCFFSHSVHTRQKTTALPWTLFRRPSSVMCQYSNLVTSCRICVWVREHTCGVKVIIERNAASVDQWESWKLKGAWFNTHPPKDHIFSWVTSGISIYLSACLYTPQIPWRRVANWEALCSTTTHPSKDHRVSVSDGKCQGKRNCFVIEIDRITCKPSQVCAFYFNQTVVFLKFS